MEEAEYKQLVASIEGNIGKTPGSTLSGVIPREGGGSVATSDCW
jgi:hypothetical protein